MPSSTQIHYASDELDAMAGARNYYRWILEGWRPHLGRVVVEIGAGIGTFSAHLLNEAVDRLFLVEPAPTLSARLAERFSRHDRVRVVPGILEDVRETLRETGVDSIVAVNVLEHIDDDAATIRAAHDILVPGGRALIFVPAFPLLYGSMDRTFGHVRRYTRPGLTAALETAGFEIVVSRYVNMLGIVSWLLAGRVLRQRTLTPGAVALADRTLIPFSAGLERWLRPPVGQNLMIVARKPAGGRERPANFAHDARR